jgi:hypothetical protein
MLHLCKSVIVLLCHETISYLIENIRNEIDKLLSMHQKGKFLLFKHLYSDLLCWPFMKHRSIKFSLWTTFRKRMFLKSCPEHSKPDYFKHKTLFASLYFQAQLSSISATSTSKIFFFNVHSFALQTAAYLFHSLYFLLNS